MAGLKLEGFQGLAPRYSERLLPPMAAVTAQNTKLLNGEIRGFRSLFEKDDLTGLASTVRRAMRVPDDSTGGVAFDPNCVLLAGLEGADAATAYTEESLNAAVATFNGGAQLDTAQFNSGASSLLLDGVDSYISFPDIAAYDLGTTDWTIEGFVRLNSLPPLETSLGPGYMLFDMQDGGGALLQYALIQDGFGYRVRLSGPASEVGTIGGGLSTGVWYHWAMTRTGGQIRCYFNGNYEVGDFGVAPADMGGPTLPIVIGRRTNGADAYLDGHVDDYLFTAGTAKYTGTGSYVVPSTPFDCNIVTPAPGDAYIAFNSRDVSIVKSPLINDLFERYFWAGDGPPKMNTAQRIKDGDPEYLLGIPSPTVAPNVVPPVGADETRAYVYTFESSFGEEGPPSPPTVVVGASGTPWELSSLQTAVPDASLRDVTVKNIYRTVPGNVSTSFFFVAQIPVAQSTYSDNETNESVAANNLLESTTWVEPPDDMEGFVVMPNGYLVGWVGTRLLFSEPYRPHAWPAAYELATEFPIVALGVFGTTLVIGTESQPYFGQGVSPASFTTMKIDAVEPCLSRRGMVSTTGGVYYPSINGLVAATGGGVMVITKDILTKEEWASFSPDTLYAAQLGLQYIAFSDENTGFLYDPQEPSNKLVTLDGFSNVAGIETDPYTGNVYLLTNDRYAEWDPEGTTRLNWRWKSKFYHFPKPLNFGAVRVMAELGGGSQAFPVQTILRPYNEALFTAINALPVGNQRLNTLNGVTLGGTPAQQSGLVAAPEAETRQSLGASLMYNLTYLSMVDMSVRFIAYIRRDQVTKKVVDTVVTTEKIIRLPTGFKADLWQFEMTGDTAVYSVQIAETPKQLAGI